MHPIIISKKSKVTELIVKWCHVKSADYGSGISLNEIDRDFWIINASSLTSTRISGNLVVKSKLPP